MPHVATTLNNLIRVEIISVGHINILVEVELMWVQDHRSSLKSSQRFMINTLSNTCKTKAAQK